MKKETKKKNNKKLAIRLIVAVVLLGVLICSVSSFIGYRIYKENIEKQYNETAYQIAEVAKSYLNISQIKEYMGYVDSIRSGETSFEDYADVVESSNYQHVMRSLNTLREDMGANDIYVSTTDMEMLVAGPDAYNEGEWVPITYLYDAYYQSELSFPFGYSGKINPDFIDIIEDSVTSHERPDNFFISESEFGYNTSAVLNVYDEGTDEYLFTIGVEVPMSTIISSIRSYVLGAVLVTVIIELIFIAVYMAYITKHVITPIKTISHEVTNFVENENSISDSIEKIHTRDEIQQLAEDIVTMEGDINNYIRNITAITAEKERIGAELNVATKIQADMLPSNFPAFPDRHDFDICASMTPAKEVGGDFYDFFMLDPDHIALVIADVSGKGVPAALFMVIAKTLLKNQANVLRSPKLVLETVNNQLCENNTSEMFVTAWFCIFELSTGHCIAANAGHEFPAIRKANGEFELIRDRHGFVLAGMEDSRYREYEFDVEDGGTLFVYTDGVAEATNASNELFGTDRMLTALNQDSGATPAQLLKNVKAHIDTFVGEAPQFDDITMLCIKRH